MNRRALLKLFAAAALTGCGRLGAAAKDFRVVLAGAGIIGASIAYHLAKAGARVTVIDRQGPASHASRGTFAWINATWAKQPRNYHSLTQDSVTNWTDLQQALNLPVRWGGSLEWFESEERQDKLAKQISEQYEWGERARMIGPSESALLEPNVDFGDAQQVAFSENDGTVDPVVATQLLLAAAKRMGAVVNYPCELIGVSYRDGRLGKVDTSLGTLQTDKLVLATGAAPDAAKRFADSDIPQRSRPGVIAITTPMSRCINRVIVAPGIHMHQRDDGRVVLGEQDGAPQTHIARLEGRPNDFPAREIAAQHGERMLAVARRFAPCMADAVIDNVYIGWRPLPIDGHPVLGASPARPDVYLAIMHSGISLAPIVGQLAAYELINNQMVDRLNEFRPGRTFKLRKRY